MATIYLARAKGAGGFTRTVAVKVCHKHLRDNPTFVAMFLDEARLAARIHHPHVVSTLDVQDEEELFLVMEYIEGGHLAQIVRRQNSQSALLPISIILRIVHDALEGLHAAHELRGEDGRPLQLIHRDVSPQNILVGIDGISRIADFGVAKAEERAVSTEPGEVKGKYAYMAPEQVRGQDITRRADIFSASVVLWESLTNRRLFRGETGADSIVKILGGSKHEPSLFRPGLSPDIDHLVMKGLHRDPAKRFSSAREMAAAIEEVETDMATTADVASLVTELLVEEIEQHRSILSQTGRAHVEVLGATPADNGTSEMVTTVVDGAASASMVRVRPRSRRWIWLVASTIALLAVAGLWLGLRGEDSTTDRVDDESTSGGSLTPATVGSATARDGSMARPQPVTDADPYDATKTTSTDASIPEREPAVKQGRRTKRNRATRRKTPSTNRGKQPAAEYQPQAI